MVGDFRQRKLAGNTLQAAVGPDGKYTYYGNEDYYDALYKDHTFAQSHNVSISGSNGKSVTTLPHVYTITTVCSIITRIPTAL